ncbi:PrgI family protein [Catellatospora sp. KI3]|uniref:PrgI family protein n=1 Tax=Catellatospora sp. KI3 TaxID=3041620 RepID=UPI0024826E62|nr:PrgI family protein [Catellatospora sp. KI3]MDI1463423.1 PrgI family protein [Catellatospora sp. KI3]
MRHDPDVVPVTRIPADVNTPDKIAFAMTARQIAVLSTAAVAVYGIYRALAGLVGPATMLAIMLPLGGVATAIAMGSRDGLPLESWMVAALRFLRAPKILAPAADGQHHPPPAWAPHVDNLRLPAVLRLPAGGIDEHGIVDTGDSAVALVACTTLNIGLRTGDEQAALLAGYGRWLNSLTGPVQVVVSTQRVDLSSHAQRITERADLITSPALAAIAVEYAGFLHDLAEHQDPLWRTVTIAVSATGEAARTSEVIRRAEQTAIALTALGASAAVLDGARATAVLTTAVDPYVPTDATWPRSRSTDVITGGTP